MEWLLRALALLAVCASPSSVFGSEAAVGAVPAREQYIVMAKKYLFVQPNASATPPLIRDEEIARLGGSVEYRSDDRLVVSLPAAAVEAVRRHGSVKYLQRTVKGPQPVVTPIGTTAPTSPASGLRPASDALRPTGHATWDSGTYLYDGAGNITNIGAGNVYVYDPLARLARANIGTNTEIYTYDGFGNLTQRETNGISFPVTINPINNRLVGATYDPAGNLTAIGVQAYAYDPFSMMRQRGTAPDPDLYVYTADDERIGVRSGNYWLWSFRDASGKVIRQYESIHGSHMMPWRWVEDYVYRDGLLLGAERVPEEGGRRHFHLDHLGTPRLITGENGLTVSQHDYFPFGNEITPLRQETPNGFDREEPMKFTGHERDFNGGTQTENTNYLDYMHARSTNSSWGRFLSVDPVIDVKKALAEPQRWNRYAYVMNNPLRYTDPTGREADPFELQGLDPQGMTTFANTFLRLGELREAFSGFGSAPINERLMAGAIGAVSALEIGSNFLSPGKATSAVLLGENMTRVAAGAKVVGANIFRETGGTFTETMAKNMKWLAKQVASGAKIYDIGLDASRGGRTGVFFKAEVAFMEKMGYTRKFVKTVEIDGKNYRMYEWMAK